MKPLKYLLAILMTLFVSVGHAEIFTYTDRSTFENDLPALKIVKERFTNQKKWGPTFQTGFDVPQVPGPIKRAGVRWDRPDACFVTFNTEGKGNGLVTHICNTGLFDNAGYDVSATQSNLICAFGADFNTWFGVSDAVQFTVDGRIIGDDEPKLDDVYQFVGFIDTDCGSQLEVRVPNDAGDGAYNFRTRDAIIGRTVGGVLPDFSELTTPVTEPDPQTGDCPDGQYLDPENGECEDL